MHIRTPFISLDTLKHTLCILYIPVFSLMRFIFVPSLFIALQWKHVKASPFSDRWHIVNEFLLAGLTVSCHTQARTVPSDGFNFIFSFCVTGGCTVQQRMTCEMDKRKTGWCIWQWLLALFCHFSFLWQYNKNKARHTKVKGRYSSYTTSGYCTSWFFLVWRGHIFLVDKSKRTKNTTPEPRAHHNKTLFCTFFPQCPSVTELKEFHNLHLRQLLKCSFGLKCQINPKGRINPLFGVVYQRHCPSIYLSLGRGSECQLLPSGDVQRTAVDNVVMDVRVRKPMWHECGSGYKKCSWSLVRSMSAHSDPLRTYTNKHVHTLRHAHTYWHTHTHRPQGFDMHESSRYYWQVSFS